MFLSATQPPRGPPPRHNFVVSAITFEGFKSSNLTHALVIQISRTSSIIDIVVPSKMAAGGHFVQKFKKKQVAYRCEMARNVIESYFLTSKMAAGGHFVQNLNKKLGSVNAIKSEFRTSKMANRSEMARNALKSEFRTSKIGAGGHFVKMF